jgi:hypothetical protein
LANIAVTIFRVNVCWLGVFWKPYIEQVEGGKWDVTKQIGRVEEQAGYYPIGHEHVVEEDR